MTGGNPTSSGGENETTRDRIDRLIAEGRIERDAVEVAERFWNEHLAAGVSMPNGDKVLITVSDLYHVIADGRIRRRPDRILHMLLGVFEIRTTQFERRIALARWSESGQTLVGLVILDPDFRLRSMHVVDDRRIRREQRKGILLWRQQEHTFSGPDPKTTC